MMNEALREQVEEAVVTIQEEARKRPVILVFGLGSYGDVIQITPLLQALNRKFPQAGLLLLHNDQLGAKLLESAPYLAKYIRLRSSLHYLLRSQLRDKGYDLMVESRYAIRYTLSSKPGLARRKSNSSRTRKTLKDHGSVSSRTFLR